MRVGLFPGQGLGAGHVLDALPQDDPHIRIADEVLGYRLLQRVESVARKPSATLPTALAQPAIFTAGVVAFRRAQSEKDVPDCLLGHSLGEYAALVAGGAMSFEQTLRVVAVRGESMQGAGRTHSGAMAAVIGLDLDDVEQIARNSGVHLANDNAPGQVVLAGPEDRIANAAGGVRAAGGRSILLDVSGAFHSPSMASAAEPLRDALDYVEIRSPRIPVLSNVTARPYRAPGEIRRLLIEQLTCPVRFRDALEWLWRCGVRNFMDYGPGSVVAGLAQRTFRALGEREVAVNV